MKKIPSLFLRHYEGGKRGLVYDEVTPGAEWVAKGEGIATRKWDGTACLYRDGRLRKRYDAKAGKTPPEGFEPAQPEPDPVTKHWPGWVPVSDGAEDRWHVEALSRGLDYRRLPFREGQTYELVGPKVNGNHDDFAEHWLIPHGSGCLELVPRDFDGLRAWLTS